MHATSGSLPETRTEFRPARLFSPRDGVPGLLVSVRDADEGTVAIGGGADVLDLKEPDRGSLGMAQLPVICGAVARFRQSAPVTAALGEVDDWIDARDFPALPSALACVKLGLAGLRRRSHWESEWVRVRSRFDAAAGASLAWVAVVYADGGMADSPGAEAVIDAAAATGCRGVLIDTFSKSRSTLLNRVTIDQLDAWTAQAHETNLFMAFAGRLSAGDLPQLRQVPADIIAIRSAACVAGRRDGPVSGESVAAFKQRLAGEYSHAEDRRDRGRRTGTV